MKKIYCSHSLHECCLLSNEEVISYISPPLLSMYISHICIKCELSSSFCGLNIIVLPRHTEWSLVQLREERIMLNSSDESKSFSLHPGKMNTVTIFLWRHTSMCTWEYLYQIITWVMTAHQTVVCHTKKYIITQ